MSGRPAYSSTPISNQGCLVISLGKIEPTRHHGDTMELVGGVIMGGHKSRAGIE